MLVDRIVILALSRLKQSQRHRACVASPGLNANPHRVFLSLFNIEQTPRVPIYNMSWARLTRRRTVD